MNKELTQDEIKLTRFALRYLIANLNIDNEPIGEFMETELSIMRYDDQFNYIQNLHMKLQ